MLCSKQIPDQTWRFQCHCRSLLLLIVLLAWMVATPVQAACGPYKVAMYELSSLYYREGDEQAATYAGIDKDIVEEVAKRTSCRLNQYLDSRVRIWAQMAEGTLDMSVSGIPNPEREQFARFIIYFKTRNYVLLRNKQGRKIDSLDAFNGNPALRLAVVKSFKHGTGYDMWIDSLRSQSRVDEYADSETVARMVALGRADAFLAMPFSFATVLKRHQLEGKVDILDLVPDDSVSLGLILSRKRVKEEDAALMQKAIDAMRQDGTLERIYQNYLPPAIAKQVLP